MPSLPASRALRIALFADRYPTRSETFVSGEVAALRALGHDVRVHAGTAGDAQDTGDASTVLADCDGARERATALVWLVTRHPVGSVRDLWARRRWRAEEWPRPLRHLAPTVRRVQRDRAEHLHAHFAAGAALDALRTAALLNRPYSVTAHAYDIYAHPRNLREKLERAAFATSGCQATVEDLRALAPHAEVHEVVMGVDADVWARSGPLPGGRRVVAVGRLVEKKGFDDLLDALALAPGVTLEIVGDGPLGPALRDQADRLGVADRVTFSGAGDPATVRGALERADVLAAPCVVAADGDRDSMPVVVKEAMAMELLVVATDVMGLPELVEPPWGLLVAPRSPRALADALQRQLELTPSVRASYGRLARAAVLRKADRLAQTAGLADLVVAAADRPRR